MMEPLGLARNSAQLEFQRQDRRGYCTVTDNRVWRAGENFTMTARTS